MKVALANRLKALELKNGILTNELPEIAVCISDENNECHERYIISIQGRSRTEILNAETGEWETIIEPV